MRTKLYNFAREDCGHTALEPLPHREICDFLERSVEALLRPPFRNLDQYGTPKRVEDLCMIPRGFFKTTIGAVDLSIFVIKHNPNVRILLDSHTSSHSEETLDAIKSIIESPDFIAEHGDWKRGKNESSADYADRWSRSSITVAQRDQIGLREPTITCTGVDQSKVGGHYDLIIPDDLADGKNTVSAVLRTKTRKRLGEYIPLLNPGGSLVMLGTRWHQLDVYHDINEDEKKRANTCSHPRCRIPKRSHTAAEHPFVPQEPRFRRMIRRIWTDDGRPYFPARFPAEEIARLQLDLTEDEFAKWYLNEPIDEGSRVFHPSYFKFFDGVFSVDDRQQPIATVTPLN